MTWSLVLGAAGVLSLWLAGNKTIWAWVVGLATQGAWVSYAIATTQYGFMLSAAAFISVYVRNWIKWSKDSKGRGGELVSQ